MIKDINIDMVIQKNKNMTIQEKNGKISLIYKYKIIKKQVIRKNKAQTVNTFYSAFFPPEIYEYFKIKENTIFFYKKENQVIITSKRPLVEHQQIKIQSSNQFSIPRSFFNPEKFKFVEMTLDFSEVDDYKSGLGVLTMELV